MWQIKFLVWLLFSCFWESVFKERESHLGLGRVVCSITGNKQAWAVATVYVECLHIIFPQRPLVTRGV